MNAKARVLFLALTIAASDVSALAQGSPPEGASVLYDSDPAHPWNRVHAALFRREAGGRVLGLDEPFPLLWPSSTYLLDEARHTEAMAALGAMAGDDVQGWIDEPLKRAVLQHDLWTFFDQAVAQRVELDLELSARWELARRIRESGGQVLGYAEVQELPEKDWAPLREELRRERATRSARRDSLARVLARAIARLALTAEEIEALPDNYAAAAAAGVLPSAHDADRPLRTFLPRGLGEPGSAWLRLGAERSPADPLAGQLAGQHAAVFGGRSEFAIFLRLPGERESALAYLAELRGFPEPLVPCAGECGWGAEGDGHAHLNPAAPNPPPGSEVALVRSMLVIDDTGEPRATAIVQSVQVRAFLEPAANWKELAAGYPPYPEDWPHQSFGELRLDRARLFAGEPGLVAIGPGEHAFHFLGSHGDGVDLLPEGFDPARGRAHLASCSACHGIPGIHSVSAYTGFATGPGTHLRIPLHVPPRRLVEASAEAGAASAGAFKRARYDFGVLRGLLLAER